MDWQSGTYGYFLVFSTLMSVIIAIYAWRHREIEGGVYFSLFMFSAAVWALGDFVLLSTLDSPIKILGLKIKFSGILPMPVFFLLFVLDYTGLKPWLTRQRVLLLSIFPALTWLIVLSLDFHSWFLVAGRLVDDGQYLILQTTKGIWFWLSLAYSFILMVVGIVILIRMTLRVAPIYRNQAYLTLVAVLIPSVVNVLFQFGFRPFLDFNLTSSLFGIMGLVVIWALYRFQFLSITPVARDIIIESMREGMLVLDNQNRIVDINPAMLRFLEMSSSDILGRPASKVLQHWQNLLDQLEVEADTQAELISERDGTRRCYDFQISSIANWQGKITSRLIIMHDISSQREALSELDHYANQNAHLLAKELHQRQLAESLRQTMIVLSSSLEYSAIIDEILAQLKKVIPYYSAAIYLLDEDELRLERVVGPESITDRSYTTPRRYDQVKRIFKLQKAEVFLSAFSEKRESIGEPVYSSMAAPLVVGQEALGVLTIDRFEPQPFTQDDAEILQAFTNQAAIAVKNAQYYHEAQAVATNQERSRLAQNLHDAVTQTLFTASIMAEALPKVWERDPEQGKQGLEEIRQLTRGALAEMRTLLLELRPQSVTEKALGDVLDQLTRAISSRARIPIELEIESDTILPADVQVNFYRIAQETFNNIVKHANASRVNVQLDAWRGHATLIIIDDGQGFDIDEVVPGHLGLGIMRDRAHQIGAELSIISQPNQGTEVSIHWQKGGNEL